MEATSDIVQGIEQVQLCQGSCYCFDAVQALIFRGTEASVVVEPLRQHEGMHRW